MELERFTHVANFTGYMGIVSEVVLEGADRQRILDVPAGSGRLADALEAHGHEVVRGDINDERPEFVRTDMEKPLPFDDAGFDTVICLEGIEHVLDPTALVGELCRVCRPGGRIVLSLPNVQNLYSRLCFLFSGHFYQFAPRKTRHRAEGELVDRGHISPLSYFQLRYLFGSFGARVRQVRGDRYKRKILFPLYLPIVALGRLGAALRAPRSEEERDVRRDMFSAPALFSRSLILVFEKEA